MKRKLNLILIVLFVLLLAVVWSIWRNYNTEIEKVEDRIEEIDDF